MIWNIIVDSSCDLSSLSYVDEKNEIRFFSVPFIITAKGKDFIDDDTINLPEMLEAMETDTKASHTSCPSPASWLSYFEMEGNHIAITISKELSGSYNSACVARTMALEENSNRNITIVNSTSAGAGLCLLVYKTVEKIRSGCSFEQLSEALKNDVEHKRTIFTLCSFGNLVKNGRMSPVIGLLAKALGFWGVGVASKIGTIEIKGKERGEKRAVRAILEDMEQYPNKISIAVISHCENPKMAENLKAEMESRFPGIQVAVFPTKGLCSYYAERHGLIVAYSM